MTRQQWLDEVATWEGTPYRWQGRTKGDGVDCWGIIVGSCQATGYFPGGWDYAAYSRRTNLAALSNEVLPRWFDEVPATDLQEGDIVVWHHGVGTLHFGVLYSHEYGCWGVTHLEDRKQVLRHHLTDDILQRIAQVWRPRYEQ